MITNPLLEEKYRVQRELEDEAGGDIHKFMENIRRVVAEAEECYGVEFKYYHDTEKDRATTTENSKARHASSYPQ